MMNNSLRFKEIIIIEVKIFINLSSVYFILHGDIVTCRNVLHDQEDLSHIRRKGL